MKENIFSPDSFAVVFLFINTDLDLNSLANILQYCVAFLTLENNIIRIVSKLNQIKIQINGMILPRHPHIPLSLFARTSV